MGNEYLCVRATDEDISERKVATKKIEIFRIVFVCVIDYAPLFGGPISFFPAETFGLPFFRLFLRISQSIFTLNGARAGVQRKRVR